METSSIANVTLDSLCIIINVILLICLSLGNTKGGLNKLFFWLLAMELAMLAGSLISWAADGGTWVYIYPVIAAANFSLYFFWYILRSGASLYVYHYISGKSDISRTYIFIIWGLFACSLFFLILSQFTGLIYTIDEHNRFQRSNLYWISYVCPIMQYILDLLMIFRHRKILGRRDIITLLTFELLPVVSLAVQIPLFGIMLLNTASTISLLIIYLRIQIEENKRLDMELADSRVSIMLNQIQPHFLYNSLLAISQLCLTDPKQASETVDEFSRYLRGNLDSLTLKAPIPFSKELEHVENYLAIEKKRFGQALNIVYDIQERSFMLPAMTLQVMVENAVRHGVTQKENGGTVYIRSVKMASEYWITIIDDGVGFHPDSVKDDGSSHIGIENTRGRLHSMCEGRLDIKSLPGEGTTVVIIIPDVENST